MVGAQTLTKPNPKKKKETKGENATSDKSDSKNSPAPETKAENATSEKSDSKNPPAETFEKSDSKNQTSSMLDSRDVQRPVAADQSAASVHKTGKTTKVHCFGGQCPGETGETSTGRVEALSAETSETTKCWGGLCT